MKAHDNFIATYKELEKILDIQVREYEDSLPEDEAQKLRLCRMMRNYIQHTGDYEKFIAIAPGMQLFLEETVKKLKCKDGTLKDNMLSVAKYGFVSETDTLADAAVMMQKKKRTDNIVLDKNGAYCGYITKSLISDLFGAGSITGKTKISKILGELSKPVLSSQVQTTPMCDVSNGTILVTNTAGKIVGVFLQTT